MGRLHSLIQFGMSRMVSKLVAANGLTAALLLMSCPVLGGEPTDSTHKQSRVIRPISEDEPMTLKSFCLTPEGNLVALVAKGEPAWGAAPPTELPTDAPDSADADEEVDEVICDIRILDKEGTLITKFPVDFEGHSINVAPDGNIYVGGNGIVAKYNTTGQQLVRTSSPNITADSLDEKVLRARAIETLEQSHESLASALKNLEKQQAEIEDKTDDELTDEQLQAKRTMVPLIEAYKSMLERRKETPSEVEIQSVMERLAGRQKTINAIAVNEQHVFVTCAASKGYGYAVWRTDLDFENPKMVVDGLRGCCGQMDVQCCGDEMFVAENSRHRVVRFDTEGQELANFGKRSRDGIGSGFGGCCNPMNTRLVGETLYVSESDGTIKRFAIDGEYLGLVGKANVPSGCKSSIVAATDDGDLVYYFDVKSSAICVLERAEIESDNES